MHKRNHKYLVHFEILLCEVVKTKGSESNSKSEHRPFFFIFWKCHKRHQNENYTILHKKNKTEK